MKSLNSKKQRARYIKAVDTSSNEIIGFAGWQFVIKDSSGEPDAEKGENDEGKEEGEVKKEGENSWGIGANAKFCVDAFCVADEHMDRSVNYGSYAKLSTIAINPSHQRRGIGSQLLEEGLKEIDQLGLPCVLGASPEGETLYRRYGWEEVEVMEMRLWEYEGGEGMGLARHVVMCRPTQSKGGISRLWLGVSEEGGKK